MNTQQIKVATTQYGVIDLIKNRFSPRAFSNKVITLNDVNALLEAASWAPSAMNEQPWHYTVALKNNTTAFQQLTDLLMPNNALWAKNAGALILCTAKLNYSQNQQHNPSALHDLGMANQNLLLQAVSMGIYGHVMGGFHVEQAKENFNISNDFQPISIIALGYLGEAQTLTSPFKEREQAPRTRKPLKEVVTFL